MREIKWPSLPEGIKVASKPSALDASLVGQLIFICWEAPYGWSMGTITELITSAIPCLFKKFHYRIKYNDGAKGPASLPLDNYASGEGATYNSWCLLEKDADTE